MPFTQLTLELGSRDPAVAEDCCFEHGALSVTLLDAGDDPVLEPPPGATPLWKSVRLAALFSDDVDAGALAAAIGAALGLPPEKVQAAGLEDRAWEREWLRDFRPMRFGRRLWICPGGQRAPDPEAVILELDPGLAFGTGTHPTTALCLEWLDAAPLAGCSVLDYGCGSGVLALAALALGATGACALDIDPQAWLATHQNARRNRLEAGLEVVEAIAPGAGPWDVVLANILAGPLIRLAPALARHTRPGGDLLLAGLLDEQAESVAVAYRPWFHMQVFRKRDGWTVLSGRRLDLPVE